MRDQTVTWFLCVKFVEKLPFRSSASVTGHGKFSCQHIPLSPEPPQLWVCCLRGHGRVTVDSVFQAFHLHSYISSQIPALILSAFLCLTQLLCQSLGHHDRLSLVTMWQFLLHMSSSADWTCLSMSCWFLMPEHDSRQFGFHRCHSRCDSHFQPY